MESEEERSPAITKARRRSRGLVSFIGHLYNRDLLHYSIMRICTRRSRCLDWPLH